MKKCLVTGAAGFIGSALIDRLICEGNQVVGIDNFSTGHIRFLENAIKKPNFNLCEVDLLDVEKIKKIFSDVEIVFHLAANADVRFGTKHPSKDLEQNIIATHNVLEAMRANQVKKIVFSSTGSVYGECPVIPTPENGPFPIQTSLYGASKVAAESLIQAYCEGFGFRSWIFRFVSILGERYTHGHIFDFYKSLKINPQILKVLGNGKQRKSYLHVEDCIEAILLALKNTDDKVNIFNLGLDDYCEVNQSITWICQEMNVAPQLHYSGDDRGWTGDNPFIFLETKKISKLGWKPKYSIKDGVIKTLKYLKKNEWVFNQRS